MNDFAFHRHKVLGVADHTIVKTRTHGQQNVAVLHGIVGFNRAVHAQHAQEFFVAGRISAQTQQSVGHGVAKHVNQRAQFIAGIAQQHTTAGIDIGALGSQQQLQRFANLARMTLFDRVVRAHLHFLWIAGVYRLLEGHILRDINHHRAGATRARNVKGLLHGVSQITHILDQEVVLDDRPGNTHGVTFLECVSADGCHGSLSADHHQGNRVGVGRGNAGDRVGQAGAGGD